MVLTLDLCCNLAMVLTLALALTLTLSKFWHEWSLRCIVLTPNGGIVLQPARIEKVVGCIHAHCILLLCSTIVH